MLITIKYEHLYGGSFYDRSWWTAIYPSGTLYDYNTKKSLKKSIEDEGFVWQVIRQHKGGATSILERSAT